MKLRNLFLVAGSAIIATSCSEDTFDQMQQGARMVALSASVEVGTTRASFGEDGKLAWSAGDAIWVQTSNGSACFVLDTEDAGQATGDFTGALSGNETLGTIAIYPYNQAHSASGTGAISVTLADTYKVTDFNNTNAIMLATGGSAGSYSFMHLGGMLRFKISNFPQGATQAVLTTGNNITGAFDVSEDTEGGNYIITSAASETNNSVTLNFNGTTVVEAKEITFPLPTGNYTGVKLEIKDATGKVLATYNNPAKAYTVKRAKRYNASITFANIQAGSGEGVIQVEAVDAQLQAALNSVGAEAVIELGAGNYEEAILNAEVGQPTSTVGIDPYTFNRQITNLTLKGSNDAKVAGFRVNCGYGVVYSSSDLFNEALKIEAHPGYYNVNRNHTIGTLTFKGITFTNMLTFMDGTADDNNIAIENLVFEDVIFDMEGVTASAVVHLIQENADVNNVTFRNCTFKNCGNIQKLIAFDARMADDVNITVEGCSFDAYAYNAMQFGGTGSSYTGTITIKDNTIDNTAIKDRAVRISTASGSLSITDNTLDENATDTDGEAMKWGGTPALTFTNNTINGKALIENGGIAKADPTVYATTAPELVAAFTAGAPVVLQDNITLDPETALTVPADATMTLDLNGKTLTASSATSGKNNNAIVVAGSLAISNGTFDYSYTGSDMGWNNCASNFWISGSGVLKLNGVTVNNNGGTSMNYCVDMTNSTGLTFTAENCEFNANYIGIRVFNNTANANNVTLKNCEVKAGDTAFWVQFYESDSSYQNGELNLNIYNNGNVFQGAEGLNTPIIYGQNAYTFFNEKGEIVLAQASTNAAFASAIQKGVSNIELKAGTFTLPSSVASSKNTTGKLNIKGAGETTAISGCANANGIDVTMESLKWTSTNSISAESAFTHAKSVKYNDCTILGRYYAQSSAPHTFTDCTIDPQNDYVYTYNADCTFTGCTFNCSEGKAIQVYGEDYGRSSTVTVSNCAFTTSKQATSWLGTNVTAIDINTTTNKFTVVINNCTVTGFPTATFSNSNLWNIKGGEANVKVTVNGSSAHTGANMQ